MRFDISDEISDLARLLMQHGEAQRLTVEGACWALGRLTGEDPNGLVSRVRAEASGQTAGLNPLLAGGPVPSVLVASPTPPVEPLGYFAVAGGDAWPITKLAVEPTPADMSKPPAPPSDDSFSAMNEARMTSGESEIHLPMDEETLAAVEAEIEAGRRGEPFPVPSDGA